MMPPLASSRPDTGRKRTEMSASENFLSSKTATAQGWVSTVCASTWRFSDGRRTHCPATNFHFGFSAPRSYFIVVLSPAAAANVAVDTNVSSASTRFICEVLLACSIQALGHDLPVVAFYQCHLGDGRAGIQARNRDHGPVSRVGLDRRRGGVSERAFCPRHRRSLALSRCEIPTVGDGLDLAHVARAVVDDDFRERVARGRVRLPGVHGQLKRAVVDLVLTRERCPDPGTCREPAFERQRRAT